MRFTSLARNALVAVYFLAFAATAQARLSLDPNNSSLEFISTKNNSIAESHSFGALSGSVADDGSVNLAIELDTVNTLIEIRDERVRKMLFDTANFPLAKIATKVDAALLQKILEANETVTLDIPVTVSLHGQKRAVNASVVLAPKSGGGLLAVTARPIVIRAADFNLENGIELLRKVAGLNSISSSVPVSFRLEFVPTR
ncbi:MAG: YceI family protein [Halioglobus sp.]